MKTIDSEPFENFKSDEVQSLWRVAWWRLWGPNNSRRMRCVDYFSEEAKAWEFAAIKTEAGYEVVRVDEFELNMKAK